ncbi:hypothetical protein RFI_00038 [Reticulomyxa filosa]|uniref:Uncharacterized protein n=1 Tax=Reticulomyxa filosa TaxID=46433 RepID=X6PEV6_RETFI|nr:hypothetical protein RFI_00038 [Reticulomyxa filosa]|eukprot:ETO37025.1 hypothetical protein RFI_00038 [Reticulomyxa filosa]
MSKTMTNHYLMKNSPHNFILSRSALRRLGYALRLEHGKFDHAQSDEIVEHQDLEPTAESISDLYSDAVGSNETIECHNIDIVPIAQNKLVESAHEQLHEYKSVCDHSACNTAKLLPEFVSQYTISQRMCPVTLQPTSEQCFEKVVHESKLRKLYIDNEYKEFEALSEQERILLGPLDQSNMPLEQADSLPPLETIDKSNRPSISLNNVGEVVSIEHKKAKDERYTHNGETDDQTGACCTDGAKGGECRASPYHTWLNAYGTEELTLG